ncbi:MAG: SAM-dependent methyltransferase [Herminiimonas sp.]|nr:SAM-dependent methyltransferase [Herminiimonas sp.]
MNKAKLKTYAPQARNDFIAAVTARANLLGLSEKGGKLEVAGSHPHGDVTVIAGQAWPVKVHSQREQLITRIQRDGFAQTMEAVAYTWFNRFAALRYMELHDYLGHGHRALSSKEGTLPDILTHAADLARSGELPGLEPALVTEMQLAGNRDGELYRLLLVAQCNALNNAMPFLFERIDDDTELVLPDNLLRTDSVIAKLITSIAEEDWNQVEIIGWLYQFYISEKKDEVIGKMVKSEDIPAATQLFTPNWIVQYLVQNSVGRLWLMANPASTLKSQWPYYIEPAQQTPEVQARLDALIQTRMNEDGGSLNPESITLLDPACGSGHILVEAYEVLRAIYLERGYQPRSIPRLILEKNLYGLDIDDRAAQMAGFALLMKARADDRRLFIEPVQLNVLALQESKGLDADELTHALQTVSGRISGQSDASLSNRGFGADDFFPGTRPQCTLGEYIAAADPARPVIAALIATFTQAKTFGSLIQIPQALDAQLVVMAERLTVALQNGDLYAKVAAQDLWPLVAQARVLGMQFDAVAANPPYMGSKFFNDPLKEFSRNFYADSMTDIYGCFVARSLTSVKFGGFSAFITIPNWMTLHGFSEFRALLLNATRIETLLNNGRGVFGSDFGSCAFVIRNAPSIDYVGNYKKLFKRPVDVSTNEELSRLALTELPFHARGRDFLFLPGSPISFHISDKLRAVLMGPQIGDKYEVREGLGTRNDSYFIRAFWEVSSDNIKEVKEDNRKWLKIDKAGQYRKWQGNLHLVLNWADDGREIKNYRNPDGSLKSRPQNTQYFYREAISWGKVGLGASSFRYRPFGHGFTDAAPSVFGEDIALLVAYLNSSVFSYLLSVQGESVNVTVGTISRLPLPNLEKHSADKCRNLSLACIELAEADWDRYEVSWGFKGIPWVNSQPQNFGLADSWRRWESNLLSAIKVMQENETKINSVYIDAHGLQDELSPEVPESQITLARADREKDGQRLISYAVGCMMGRYSLDAPGLIYAHAGNVGFDASRYGTFHADADGIVPLTDELWFEDDAASRTREFLLAVGDADTLDENMAWLAESLGTKGSETPDETIRRYLADRFYKDHLQTYKKRPIYWLFSSGGQGAFQALVYLHRYHEGTLARLRAEYVVPLTGKIQSRIDMLQKDVTAASSTAARNKLAKEVEKLNQKHVELLAYDEQLRHHADMRITLDLDDGVKVNYGKFGDLLAEVRAVTGGTADD